jgi:DNA repair protein RecN (Recombination protein N)
MLTDLFIRNFAIIDNLHVVFRPGLNVLTGATGAGKSIIVDAVNLILGGRASADLIRTGADEATVEALFQVAPYPGLCTFLEESGIECQEELLVKRIVSRSGRNRVFVGGGLSTLAVLDDLARRLINIYGQHESQTLLKPENHLLLLDGVTGLTSSRAAFTTLVEEYRTLLLARQRLDEGEQEALRRIDLLSFQSGEIATAAPVPGEDEELERERQLLLHAEKLLTVSRGAFERLYGDDGSIIGELQRVIAASRELAIIDPSRLPLADTLNEAAILLEDSAFELRDYSSRLEADPTRLQAVEDRLDLLTRLKRKYAPTIEEIIAFRDGLEGELDQLLNRERSRGELDDALKELESRLEAAGRDLTTARQRGAAALDRSMATELADLDMKHAIFVTGLEPLAEPRSTGMERVEFLFSPNPGETPRPLARIASGGELSRLMLALKQVHPESDVPTLVFDEVDTGIGGATSAKIGAKLRRVAGRQQVLCITHLPQVAAFADHHYRVEKRVEEGRTLTEVTLLEGDDRVAEMARMLGGVTITDTTRNHAREMIAEATRQDLRPKAEG